MVMVASSQRKLIVAREMEVSYEMDEGVSVEMKDGDKEKKYRVTEDGGIEPVEDEDNGGPYMADEEENAEPEKMSDEEFAAVVGSAIDDAADYIDEWVAPAREAATSYYRGDLFGNEEENRSSIVLTEVRDVVLAVMPPLLRIFTSAEKAVEFVPRSMEDVPLAEQATDYVNYVFYQDNNGFKVLYDAFKDALVRKTGIVQWRIDEITDVREFYFDKITLEQYTFLLNDPDLEVVEAEEKYIEEMQDGMPMPPKSEYSIRVRKKEKQRKLVVEAIPPEEFLVSRNARDLDTSAFVGRRQLKTVSDLVAMGYDKDEIMEYAGSYGDNFELNNEAFVRNPAIQPFLDSTNQPDDALLRVYYVESYIRIDKDGDGIAELRRVCSVGEAAHILHDEVVDEVPIALFCPDPEPHTVIGQSLAEQVMDLQLIKSNILRNTLDSLAQVITPRMAVVEGQVNLDDVMNTEVGAIIRQRAPGMVQPLTEAFVGQQALGVMNYLDQIKTQRTGVTPQSSGVNADILQSTTKAAVDLMSQGAEQRIELIARVFAETGMKRLFKGLLKAIIKFQDEPRIVRLRNQYVPVDPRYWDASMDVAVNVGLGNGNKAERLAVLMMILQKQEQAVQMMGPLNPVANIMQMQNTMNDILVANDFKDVTRYFGPVGPQEMQQMQQQTEQAAAKPNPAELLAEVERQKILADIEISAAKVRLQEAQVKLGDDRERDKLEADVALRAAEMEMKYGTQVDVARIRADMERERNVMNLVSRPQARPMV
jgi:hypothetical protein